MPVLRRALATLVPSRAEAWTYGFGSLLPFALLAAARTRLAWGDLDPARHLDLATVQLGEWSLWAVWGWAWWLGARLVGRFAPRAWRALFHCLTAALCVVSALDLAYYETTGSRADWEMLAYGLGDITRVWPVVASELSAGRIAVVVGLFVACLAPLLRARREGPAGWRAAPWALALVSVAWMEGSERPSPAAPLRPLQASLVDTLFWDGVERLGEEVVLPSPDALVPLAVEARPDARRPNVVLVFLESVGAKSTTAYTPTLKTTPTLAKMAEEGLRVENLTTVVPHTSKALVATLCGDWPYLRAEMREASPGGLPGRCLPELLEDVGYRTAFFQPARGDFEDRIGLVHEMGFDTFRPRGLLESPGYEKNNYFGIDDRVMIEPGLEWSTAERGQPFLATYLTLTSHHDYTVPSHWPTKSWTGVAGRRGKYLAAVNYVDDFLGRLVDAYGKAGLLGNTVFVVVGDHGEGFNEHGRSQHDLVIYEEGLRVPAVIWGPGVLDRTGVIEGARQQIDILPTVLGLAGVDVVGGATRGTDLLAAVDGRVLYHSCWRAHRCLARRDGEDKVI
ncbi:MAG: LTA synthase family protein, partial [Myxococcota bacterium]